ncbi:hypothetical protein [Paludisphaera sp.]|uniref:hypothetical protein n=1 Tax=Paludisphaera sp. TaxID=2017432 RepID=UPI00301BFE96
MPREIKVFSMSFLDLLCCALGGVILLSLLMILSMQQVASEAVKQTYFDCSAVVWVDFSASQDRFVKKGKTLVEGQKLNLDAVDSDGLREEVRQLDFGIQILYHPLFGGNSGIEVRELGRRNSKLDVHLVEAGNGGLVRVPGLHGAEVFGEVKPFSVGNLILGPPPDDPEDSRPVYYKYELMTFARRIPHGYYFFVVRAKRRPAGQQDLAERTVAWMDMSGSGVAGRLILQTHPSLPERGVAEAAPPADGSARALEIFRKKHQPQPGGTTPDQQAKALTARKRLRLPDRYDPAWQDAPEGAGRFVFMDRERQEVAPGLPAVDQPDRVYSAYFAVRHRRGVEWPFASGFPIPYPKGKQASEKGPGPDEVRWGRLESYGVLGGMGTDDYYPPGLCVTVRHP